jgi:hypothetical protein
MRNQGGPKLLMQRSKLNHGPLLNFYYYTAILSLSTFPTSSTFLSFKTLCCNSTWYYFNAFAFFSYFCLLLDCQQDSWGCRLLYHGFKSNSNIIPRRSRWLQNHFQRITQGNYLYATTAEHVWRHRRLWCRLRRKGLCHNYKKFCTSHCLPRLG